MPSGQQRLTGTTREDSKYCYTVLTAAFTILYPQEPLEPAHFTESEGSLQFHLFEVLFEIPFIYFLKKKEMLEKISQDVDSNT